MCPARCNSSSSPRQTMSRGAPFSCTQFHASHSSSESARRLALGLEAISFRMKPHLLGVNGATTVLDHDVHTDIYAHRALERKTVT